MGGSTCFQGAVLGLSSSSTCLLLRIPSPKSSRRLQSGVCHSQSQAGVSAVVARTSKEVQKGSETVKLARTGPFALNPSHTLLDSSPPNQFLDVWVLAAGVGIAQPELDADPFITQLLERALLQPSPGPQLLLTTALPCMWNIFISNEVSKG